MAEIGQVQFESGGDTYEFVDAYAREQIANKTDPSILKKANAKNCIARCKDITGYYTDGSLYTRISDGTFDDLYIGDYIKASYNGVEKTFRIAGFNTYWNQANSSDYILNEPHVVMVPDESLISAYMNSSATTANGYNGSYMNKTVIGSVVTSGSTSTVNGNLYNIFGNHLLTHQECVSSGINTSRACKGYTALTGASSSSTWTTVQAILMSEIEVYGSNVLTSSAYDCMTGNMQLPLFRLLPQYKNIGRYIYWLRNVAYSVCFCNVNSNGHTTSGGANNSLAVRPRFLIG